MRYHNITKDDMLNGDGLRVVLWTSGCSHHCIGCQNPITWNPNDGLVFDATAKEEIFEQLDKDYIQGITFSGGDPLNEVNVSDVLSLIVEIKNKYPNKTIWIYTGYTYEEIIRPFLTNTILEQEEKNRLLIIKLIDVLVDGKFIEELADVNYPWAGSINQRVIDIKETLKKGCVVLWKN